MSTKAYSPLKAAWHLDRIAAMRERIPVRPVEVQLILSDFCNQDCHFCAYRASNGLSVEGFGENGNPNPNRMIPYEKAVEIIEDCKRMDVKSIIFTGGGEPTVHPQHMELFKLALQVGIDCSLNTNGIVLRKGWEEILPLFTYIRFSIDAGTPEEYAKVRKVKPGDYDKALRNLEAVATACRDTACTVGTGYVVGPDSWPNLFEGCKNIKDSGASYVRLASLQSTEGMAVYDDPDHLTDTMKYVREAIERAKALESDDFSVIDLFDVAMGGKVDYQPCGFQHVVVYIGGNLKVYRCCYTAYTELGEAGDLSDMSFYQWVYDIETMNERYSFDARKCGTCQLDHKNRIINYVADPSPLHVNFV